MLLNNFLGKSGLTWWVGIIVNNSDPMAIGRCQVRIFGFHGDPNDPASKSNVPDTDLPWAHPIFPINNSKTWHKPNTQEWVVGFFMDGESAQMPVMWGILPGYRSVQSKL